MTTPTAAPYPAEWKDYVADGVNRPPRTMRERGDALRALGVRARLHPNDAIPMVCATRARAQDCIDANPHLRMLGPAPAGDAWVCAADLTMADVALTDPTTPDE